MSENTTVLFPDVKVGETFKIGGIEFIRFADVDGKTPVVMKDIAFNYRFGKNNNFRGSVILKKLQEELLQDIIEAVGEENVCEFETDLTTMDGLKNYGVMKSRISLPTFDFYRANTEIFDKYNPGEWWWLATAYSAKPRVDYDWAAWVAPSGDVNCNFFNDDDGGVRPFCILNSSIFESC